MPFLNLFWSHSPFFLSPSISWHPILPWGCQYIEKESKEVKLKQKKICLHELPHMEVVEYRTKGLPQVCGPENNRVLKSHLKIYFTRAISNKITSVVRRFTHNASTSAANPSPSAVV